MLSNTWELSHVADRLQVMGLRGTPVVLAVLALFACSSDGVVSTSVTGGERAALAPTTTQPALSSPTSTSEPPTTSLAPESLSEMFVPPTEASGDQTSLPVVFPDGTRAELSFPADLDLTSHGLAPYSSGEIPGFSRDFSIQYGRVDDVASEYSWELLDTYVDAADEIVPFYRVPGDEVDYLAFQFGSWRVLVYDYRLPASGPRMTHEDRAMWAENLHGVVTEQGFLTLEATPPLRLAQEGDHAGPELNFHGADGSLALYLAGCQSEGDPDRGQDYVGWCDPSSGIYIMASGTLAFTERIVSKLEIMADESAGDASIQTGSTANSTPSTKSPTTVDHDARLRSETLNLQEGADEPVTFEFEAPVPIENALEVGINMPVGTELDVEFQTSNGMTLMIFDAEEESDFCVEDQGELDCRLSYPALVRRPLGHG